MIEAIVAVVIAVVEAVVAVMTAVIEFIAGVFATGGEALTAGEAFGALLAFILEIVFWGFLWLVELVIALFTWRRPRKVSRPVIRGKAGRSR